VQSVGLKKAVVYFKYYFQQGLKKDERNNCSGRLLFSNLKGVVGVLQ
jgi:hypothetical protein